jgi:hypothetical protein
LPYLAHIIFNPGSTIFDKGSTINAEPNIHPEERWNEHQVLLNAREGGSDSCFGIATANFYNLLQYIKMIKKQNNIL